MLRPSPFFCKNGEKLIGGICVKREVGPPRQRISKPDFCRYSFMKNHPICRDEEKVPPKSSKPNFCRYSYMKHHPKCQDDYY